jgi:hypothetical protein
VPESAAKHFVDEANRVTVDSYRRCDEVFVTILNVRNTTRICVSCCFKQGQCFCVTCLPSKHCSGVEGHGLAVIYRVSSDDSLCLPLAVCRKQTWCSLCISSGRVIMSAAQKMQNTRALCHLTESGPHWGYAECCKAVEGNGAACCSLASRLAIPTAFYTKLTK